MHLRPTPGHPSTGHRLRTDDPHPRPQRLAQLEHLCGLPHRLFQEVAGKRSLHLVDAAQRSLKRRGSQGTSYLFLVA